MALRDLVDEIGYRMLNLVNNLEEIIKFFYTIKYCFEIVQID